MTTTFKTHADALFANYKLADLNNGYLLIFQGNAAYEFGAGNDHAAIAQLINGLATTWYIFGYLISKYSTSGYRYNLSRCLAESWEFTLEDPPGAVTMDSLLSVMVTATDSELMNFIGLVDAYRQSLWNKEFNAEYFAALARGFE